MEMTTNQPIIADTSGLVSLVVTSDHNHTAATQAAERLRSTRRPLLVPTDVFVETMNILGKKSGHAVALAFAAQVQQSPDILTLINCVDFHQLALDKFATAAATVSFTDCVVMAVADTYETRDIFGFDKQFEDAGYTRLTPSSQAWEDAA
jgi:predicted nucleic acid-binding protein